MKHQTYMFLAIRQSERGGPLSNEEKRESCEAGKPSFLQHFVFGRAVNDVNDASVAESHGE